MEIITVDTIKRTYVDSKLGEIKLKDAVLDQDWITMYFDVESFPEEMQRQIDEAIEKKAIEKYQKEEEKYREYGITLDNLKMKEGECKVLLEFLRLLLLPLQRNQFLRNQHRTTRINLVEMEYLELVML